MPISIDYNPCQGIVAFENAYLTYMPTAPLSNWLQSFWQLNVPEGQYSYRSVPDNCIDLIINLAAPEDTFVVTPFSTSIVFELSGPASYFGIRFHPLGHQGIITAPIGAWGSIDNIVDPSEILPAPFLSVLLDEAQREMSFKNRCEAFSKILLNTMGGFEVDVRLMRYVKYCHQNIASCVNLSDKQCSEFGLSARQLRRLSAQYLGLTPREFAKVLRFQQVLKGLNAGASGSIWAEAFYDQPHFIRDFKSITGITPSAYRNSSVLYNTGSI